MNNLVPKIDLLPDRVQEKILSELNSMQNMKTPRYWSPGENRLPHPVNFDLACESLTCDLFHNALPAIVEQTPNNSRGFPDAKATFPDENITIFAETKSSQSSRGEFDVMKPSILLEQINSKDLMYFKTLYVVYNGVKESDEYFRVNTVNIYNVWDLLGSKLPNSFEIKQVSSNVKSAFRPSKLNSSGNDPASIYIRALLTSSPPREHTMGSENREILSIGFQDLEKAHIMNWDVVEDLKKQELYSIEGINLSSIYIEIQFLIDYLKER